MTQGTNMIFHFILQIEFYQNICLTCIQAFCGYHNALTTESRSPQGGAYLLCCTSQDTKCLLLIQSLFLSGLVCFICSYIMLQIMFFYIIMPCYTTICYHVGAGSFQRATRLFTIAPSLHLQYTDILKIDLFYVHEFLSACIYVHHMHTWFS